VIAGAAGAGPAVHVDLEHPLAWCVDHALSATDCDALLLWADTLDFVDAPITTAAGPVMRPDIRNNDRAMVDVPDLAGRLYAAVEHTIPPRMFDHPELGGWERAGVNERLRVYRYGPGQSFAPHYDGAFRRTAVEESQLTLMFYLDEGCEGGDTVFFLGRGAGDQVRVTPRKGMALLFQHRILHSGSEVVAGRKTVLRSDVMFRRYGVKVNG